LTNQLDGHLRLIDWTKQVLIIAYKESTQQLETFLNQSGFACEVLRQQTQPEQENFSRSYRCLLNHRRAWEITSQSNQPSIILEADFVPVLGFGQFPLPFDPEQTNVGISWLYTCAAQVYYVSPKGYAEGFSTSTVGYIVTPKAAGYLIELAAEISEKFGPYNYSTWDSNIDDFLRQRQLKNYIPWRNYGEHGGLPNPEHKQHNLGKIHRADILYSKLAFIPMYAADEKADQGEFLRVRLWARLKGIARLLGGRFLRVKVIQGSSTPLRLIRFAVIRYFSLSL